MQLPEFLGKVGSWFTATDQKLDKLTLAQEQASKLSLQVEGLTKDLEAARADLATAKAALATEQTEHGKTKVALESAQKELATAKATIADPKGEIQTQAAVKANEIATRMGAEPIKAEDHTAEANGAAGGSLVDQYLALNAKNPQAAAKFAAQHGGFDGLMRK